jgi:hypothetical protein
VGTKTNEMVEKLMGLQKDYVNMEKHTFWECKYKVLLQTNNSQTRWHAPKWCTKL